MFKSHSWWGAPSKKVSPDGSVGGPERKETAGGSRTPGSGARAPVSAPSSAAAPAGAPLTTTTDGTTTITTYADGSRSIKANHVDGNGYPVWGKAPSSGGSLPPPLEPPGPAPITGSDYDEDSYDSEYDFETTNAAPSPTTPGASAPGASAGYSGNARSASPGIGGFSQGYDPKVLAAYDANYGPGSPAATGKATGTGMRYDRPSYDYETDTTHPSEGDHIVQLLGRVAVRDLQIRDLQRQVRSWPGRWGGGGRVASRCGLSCALG